MLDPKVQDGNKLPRWVPKARRGQFVGRSRVHASNVGQIRNLKTGNITTQFHVTYDDYFTTAASNHDNISLEETWTHLFKYMSEDLRDPADIDEIPRLAEEWLTDEERNNRNEGDRRHIDRPQRLGVDLQSNERERNLRLQTKRGSHLMKQMMMIQPTRMRYHKQREFVVTHQGHLEGSIVGTIMMNL